MMTTENGVGRRMSQLVLLLFVCALATEPAVLLFSTARSLCTAVGLATLGRVVFVC